MILLLLACTGYDAETGYDLSRDTLTFANFGGTVSPSLLDTEAMTGLFGDTACESGTSGGDCVLSGAATSWMLDVNGSMSGGRCEGFAVLAQSVWFGEDAVEDLGGASLAELELDEASGGAIAHWFATQSIPAVFGATETYDAKGLADELKKRFRRGEVDVRIGIVRIDEAGNMMGGHAVTPYAMRENAGLVEVLINDSNFPGEERFMTLDVDANAWWYEASINPEADSFLYEGNPQNENAIYVVGLEPRLGQHDFDNGASGAAYGSAVRTTGAVEVEVEVNGEVVTATAPRAEVGVEPNFSGLWADRVPATFWVPEDADVRVYATPTDAEIEDDLQVGVWRADGFVAVTGSVHDGFHTLDVSVGAASMTYETGTANGGPLLMDRPLADGRSMFAKVETSGLGGGQVASLSTTDEDLVLSFDNAAPQDVRIEVRRALDTFVVFLEDVPGDGEIVLEVAAWEGGASDVSGSVNGQAVTFEDCEGRADCGAIADDGDFVDDAVDNCPDLYNPGQEDSDGDGIGDACSVCLPGEAGDDCSACDPGEYCAGEDAEPESCGDDTVDHDADPGTPCRPCDEGTTSHDGLTCDENALGSSTLTGDAGARLGFALAGGHDLDGDGLDDLVAGGGAPNGVLGVHLGGEALDGAATTWSGDWQGWSVTTGDYDGDGTPDIATGMPAANDYAGGIAFYLSLGSTEPDFQYSDFGANAWAGVSIVTTDLNGDEVDEAFIGAPNVAGYSGEVLMYDDLISGARLSGTDRFGQGLASGDLDGDGTGELFVGSTTGLFAYDETVWSGTPLYTWAGTDLGAAMSAGDVDGDGYDDVAVGGVDAVHIVSGSASGFGDNETLVETGSFGASVAVTGSGLLVGAPAADTAWLIVGDDWTQLTGPTGFGASVSSAGHFDGDGAEDLAVGSATGGGSITLFHGGL